MPRTELRDGPESREPPPIDLHGRLDGRTAFRLRAQGEPDIGKSLARRAVDAIECTPGHLVKDGVERTGLLLEEIAQPLHEVHRSRIGERRARPAGAMKGLEMSRQGERVGEQDARA